MEMQVNTFAGKRGEVMFKVQFIQSNGQVDVKSLNYKTYLSLLTKSVHQNEYIQLGEVPTGYKEAAYADRDTYKIFLCAPAQKRLMVYQGGHYWIPFPGCLFFLEVKKGAVCHKYVYCYADEEIKDESRLFRYPFGNVSSNGSICMGNILTKRLSFEKADEFMDLFFSGVTNNDYYDKSNILPGYSLSKMINMLEKKKEFPKRWLVETGQTYAALKKVKL